MTEIVLGDVEPIAVDVRDSKGLPLAGLTDIYIRIYRESDNFFLDWSDNTFKSYITITPTNNRRLLTEVNSAGAPGIYELAGGWDTSLTNLATIETVFVTALQTPGTNARLPNPAEIKIRLAVEKVIDAELSSQHGAGSWEGAAGTVNVYESEPDRR